MLRLVVVMRRGILVADGSWLLWVVLARSLRRRGGRCWLNGLFGQFVAPEGRSVLAEWVDFGQIVAPKGRSVLAMRVGG